MRGNDGLLIEDNYLDRSRAHILDVGRPPAVWGRGGVDSLSIGAQEEIIIGVGVPVQRGVKKRSGLKRPVTFFVYK